MTPRLTRRRLLLLGAAGAVAGAAGLERVLDDDAADVPCAPPPTNGSRRPGPNLRLAATDVGPVLRHGPDAYDVRGARDVVVWRVDNTWYMHYDGAGEPGWRLCLATSTDGEHWDKRGPVLELGPPGSPDSAAATYGFPVSSPTGWHLFYLGTPNASPPPDRVPEVPYLTLKARADGPAGPWTKQPEVTPLAPQPGTFYADTAAPGSVIPRENGEYWQFFTAAAGTPLQRTLGFARTTDLNGPWTIAPNPILPPSEQIENSAVYYEQANGTWFLFTNHVGEAEQEFTDAVWVYWTQDPMQWDPSRKAVVLDWQNCCWSRGVIGLPSIVVLEGRIALFYDGLVGNGLSHVGRDIGLAWLPRPLVPPA